jgi:hypothetical protein
MKASLSPTIIKHYPLDPQASICHSGHSVFPHWCHCRSVTDPHAHGIALGGGDGHQEVLCPDLATMGWGRLLPWPTNNGNQLIFLNFAQILFLDLAWLVCNVSKSGMGDPPCLSCRGRGWRGCVFSGWWGSYRSGGCGCVNALGHRELGPPVGAKFRRGRRTMTTSAGHQLTFLREV